MSWREHTVCLGCVKLSAQLSASVLMHCGALVFNQWPHHVLNYGLWQNKVEGKRKQVCTTEVCPKAQRNCCKIKKSLSFVSIAGMFSALSKAPFFFFFCLFLFHPSICHRRKGKRFLLCLGTLYALTFTFSLTSGLSRSPPSKKHSA